MRNATQPNQLKGAALVTVLALTLLLAILILSLLSISRSSLQSSNAKEAAVSLEGLRDSAINLAINQLRTATTQDDEIWVSQPGAIRTFDKEGGDPSKIFKLYSSDQLVETFNSASQLDDDLARDWDDRPNQYADLNSPKRDANGERSYPIIDPRAADIADETPEGFSIDPSASGLVNGVSQSKALPMPVKWIYLLADGSIGTLDSSNRFQPFDSSANATETNPIVGRIAFWVDDETQKININTASEAIPWDTPRCYTPTDEDFAENIPVLNEVQRFGGHPATTCLSSVFFPGEYLDHKKDQARFKQIYDITPRVHYDGGLFSGTGNRVNFDPDRLYVSVDDLLYSGKLETSAGTRSKQTDFLSVPLSQRRFFLTANSRAPEVNPDGQPKIAMWPIHYIESLYNEFHTPYDKIIDFASKVGEQRFIYQRAVSDNQYGEWIQRSLPNGSSIDWESAEENQRLLVYLARAMGYDNSSDGISNKAVPGYDGNFFEKYGRRNMSFNLFQMFDYIRNVNLMDDTKIDSNGDGTLDDRVAPWTRSRQDVSSSEHRRIGTVNSTLTSQGVFDWGIQAGGDFDILRPLLENFQLSGTKTQGSWTLGRRYAITEVAFVFIGLADGGTPEGNKYGLNSDQRAIQVALVAEMSSSAAGYPQMVPVNNFSYFDLGNLRINGQEMRELQANGTSSVWTNDNRETTSIGFPEPNSFKPNNNFYGMWAGSGFGGTADYRLMFSGLSNLDGGVPWRDRVGGSKSGSPDDTFFIVNKDSNMNVSFAGPVGFGSQHQELQDWSRLFLIGNKFDGTKSIPVPKLSSDPKVWKERVRTALQAMQTEGPQDPGTHMIKPEDVVRSFVNSHGDQRLASINGHFGWGRNRSSNYGENHLTPFGWDDSSSMQKHTLYFKGEPLADLSTVSSVSPQFSHQPLVSGIAYDSKSIPDMAFSDRSDTTGTDFNKAKDINAISGRTDKDLNEDLYPYSIDPTVTRDWNTGPGNYRDGGYTNVPDYGTFLGYLDPSYTPYFSKDFDYSTSRIAATGDLSGPEITKPNQIVPSAGMFGSLPSMSQRLIPWTTFLFRPELKEKHIGGMGRTYDNVGSHGMNTRNNRSVPPDHLLMEYFWMPVVQPYAISEPFSTAGKVGMNYRIAPFKYIKRSTALHAVMKSERMLAIPNSGGPTYKNENNKNTNEWRYPINAELTLRQWEERFDDGDYFQTASEVCEMFLVPKDAGVSDPNDMERFWDEHQLTGDNVIERPYTNIYPRLTTKSNSYRIHYLVQTIKKGRTSDPDVMDENLDSFFGEQQGDALIERFIDPEDEDLENDEYDFLDNPDAKPLDDLYQFRIRNIRRLSN